ncbi:MAG: DMT family transporter [Mogibacterium sp.]|nr:DMT family transporter [Mogibacterium sp.]
MQGNNARIRLILSMMVFGTIGLVSRYIQLPSSLMACVRAYIGVLVILLYFMLRRKWPDREAIRRNLPVLIAAGAMMGFNWILQFESFRYTTIAIATVCYYMQPIFVMMAAPFLFREKLSGKRICCILIAFAGMILVSGALQTGFDLSQMKGVLLAVAGAALYAGVVLINKKLRDIDAIDATVIQLLVAGTAALPYTLMTEDLGSLEFRVTGVLLLLLLGAFHTGFCYIIYFDAIGKLKAQTVAILSYIDPVEAVLLSALVLHEKLTWMTVAGAVMILGATLISELGSQDPGTEG